MLVDRVLPAASNKSVGPSAMQQQQQHLMYPPVMPHYMVAVSVWGRLTTELSVCACDV